MREYGHDLDPDAGYRPKGDRPERDGDATAYRAAAAGRTDVLGTAGMLGLQRAAGNAAVGGLLDGAAVDGAGGPPEEERSPVHDVVGSGGGSPLDAGVRTEMEARFGQDFGDVRVHTDGTAHESARAVNAQAYTVGNDVVFQQGRYDPASESGRHMLAHELTHVVQQRSGPVDGTDAGGGVRISDPSDRFEREAAATADRVMASEPAAPASAGAGATAPVQRAEEGPGEGSEDEETAQTFVQRTEGGEETEETS